ncbi:MAG: hypothetical protein ACI4VL_00635 [Bacilli bacterium]
MKYLDKIVERFKVDEEEKNCPLNPFIKNYYDVMKPEYYDEAMKNVRWKIRDNNIYIRFLKIKLQENKTCTDFYNTSRFEDLIKREILELEYNNNTSKYVLDYLKYKKRKYIELKKTKSKER